MLLLKNGKLKIQFISLLILGLTIMTMSFADGSTTGLNIVQIIVAVLFWISLIIFIYSSWSINSKRKKSRTFKNQYADLKSFGLISFFKNPLAKIIDIAMIVNLLILIVFFTVVSVSQIIIFIFLGMFVILFGLHCILNGVNFKYLSLIQEEKN